MEAHGNEYLAQLLDRAANLIQASTEGLNGEGAEEERQWLAEYHQEKARFGQPEGSPAYAETRGEDDAEGPDTGNRGARGAAAENRARRSENAQSKAAPRAKK